jgi:mono/diheme cytochrome c family protein
MKKNDVKLVVRALFSIVIVSFLIFACSQPSSQPVSQSPLAVKGQSIYMANCVVCHAANPAQDGPVGPAIKGSARELVEARVLKAAYPPNYTPKRNTKVMPAFPQLAGDIDALVAFLNNPQTMYILGFPIRNSLPLDGGGLGRG